MVRKVFSFGCILSLCLASSVSVEAVSLCDDSSTRSPSLYEQFCCVENNKGKIFVSRINSDNGRLHSVFCPFETPASCLSIDFSPSCSSILANHPTATSGYYNIMLADSTANTVFCDMEGMNCDGEGGWMRVGYLNMSDPSEQCPPGYKLLEQNDTRACGRDFPTGCQSVEFRHNSEYTQVCGRVIAYQKGTPDALYALSANPNIPLDGTYIDGIIIVRGNPRKHVWTFIAAGRENSLDSGLHECPCGIQGPGTQTPPSFVGNDYFCESGNDGSLAGDIDSHLFTTDPLWDGKQCGLIEEACCNVTGIPWFNKVLEQPTTDNIELRICADQHIDNEDVPFTYYEIYIK